MPSEAVRLARQMQDSGRFEWLRGQPRYLVAQAVRHLHGWTVADVADECDRRMRDADHTYGKIRYPVSFLRKFLLAEADPARPPRQLAHAAQAAQSVRHRAPEVERARASPRPPVVTDTGRAAREQARRYAIGAAARASSTGRRAELGYAAGAAAAAASPPADPLAALAAELLAGPRACAACHQSTPDVAARRTPSVVDLCDACFASIQHVL